MVLSIVIIYCSILVLCILFFPVGYVVVLKINKRDCHFKLGCKRIICAINNSSYIGFQTGDVAQGLESEFISKDPGFDPLAWQVEGQFFSPSESTFVQTCLCRTVEHALGSVGLYHTGSFGCATDPGVACGHAGDKCPVRSLNTVVCWRRSSRWMGWVILSVAENVSVSIQLTSTSCPIFL